jgi:hypothetical protein
MADDHDKLDLDSLKRRAMEVLKGKAPVKDLKLTEAEMLKMIHELEVYSIELKMLQEELEQTDGKIVDITRKYDELSDLHNRFILHVIKGNKYPGKNKKE